MCLKLLHCFVSWCLWSNILCCLLLFYVSFPIFTATWTFFMDILLSVEPVHFYTRKKGFICHSPVLYGLKFRKKFLFWQLLCHDVLFIYGERQIDATHTFHIVQNLEYSVISPERIGRFFSSRTPKRIARRSKSFAMFYVLITSFEHVVWTLIYFQSLCSRINFLVSSYTIYSVCI